MERYELELQALNQKRKTTEELDETEERDIAKRIPNWIHSFAFIEIKCSGPDDQESARGELKGHE
jgi:hypothetical protein